MITLRKIFCPWCQEKVDSLDQLGKRITVVKPKFFWPAVTSRKEKLVCPYCNQLVKIAPHQRNALLALLPGLIAFVILFYVSITNESVLGAHGVVLWPFLIFLVFILPVAIVFQLRLRLEKDEST